MTNWGNALGVRVQTNATYPTLAWSVNYAWSQPANISESGQEGIEELSEWYSTMALVVAATLIIGLVATVLVKAGGQPAM